MKDKRTEAQIKAESKYNAKRKGTPTFSAIRLDNENQKAELDSIFDRFGSRKSALLLAGKLLKKELESV